MSLHIQNQDLLLTDIRLLQHRALFTIFGLIILYYYNTLDTGQHGLS